MRPFFIHRKAVSLLVILAASALLLIAHADLPAEDSPSAVLNTWSRLIDQACRNKEMADSLAVDLQQMRDAVASLEHDTTRLVPSASIRRNLLDGLANTDDSIVVFLETAHDFSRFMGGLCKRRAENAGAQIRNASTLNETVRTFNDHIVRINALRTNFSGVERRYNELLTSFTLHAESLEAPERILELDN